ncbi:MULTISPECIES: hypothetical protein [unclassified Mycobacterium]|uniref:hypothetical protein n=1 Tax=unclassified Mycobacterium TaxID=2642494 RepID=UPI0029C83936|nr:MULTISPECIES: hypothetical protein [unclassified Mycobacterium]
MAEGDPADKLSAKRHFVLVLRIVVEGGGKVTGELVDPSLDRRRRFDDITDLVDEVRGWIDDAIRQGSPG